MKVLYITNIPAPYKIDFFNKLSKKIDITVLFERDSANNRRNAFWYGNTSKNNRYLFLKSLKLGNESSISIQVIKYISNKKYDLIVFGGYSSPTVILSIIISKILNKKYLIHLDGCSAKKKDKYFKYLLKKFLMIKSTGFLSPGFETNNYIKKYVPNAVIYNYSFSSVNTKDIVQNIEKINKNEIRNSLGLPQNITILSIGQFIPRKGIDILLKAASHFKNNPNIVIIGGTPKQEYIDLIKSNNLKNIYFYDFQTKKELSKFYMASDIFVLPTREDVWGLVINEAMAHSLPIITTNKCTAGLELITKKKNGYIINSEDYYELAMRVNQLIENKNLRLNISRNNLTKIKKHTIEILFRRVIE